MKAKLIYTISFIIVFLFTTGAIVKLNGMYRDIFKFDFTPIKQHDNSGNMIDTSKVSFAEIKDYLLGNFKQDVLDSLKSYLPPKKNDTVYTDSFRDSSLIDSVRSLKMALKDINAKVTEGSQNSSQKGSEDKQTAKPDSSYNLWIKQTAKLYESMDPLKAAKIIQSYSDNVARDIIYTMRQKKAAEVLSELNPDTANRITRAK